MADKLDRTTGLSAIVDRHVALHHATGYLFKKQSCLLHGFAKYAEAKGDEVVRATTALEWAALGPTAPTRQGRLDVVCRFARLVRAAIHTSLTHI